MRKLRATLKRSGTLRDKVRPDSEPPHSTVQAVGRENPPESSEVPDDIKRIPLPTNRSVTEIAWNQLKSERGRNRLEDLIRHEAVRLGFTPPKGAGDVEPLFTADSILALWNTSVVGSVTAMTHCPIKIAEILAFDEQQREMINMGGAADRLVEKYIGSLNFKYRDECIVGMVLVPLLTSKFIMFKQVMTAWRKAPKAPAPNRPVAVPPVTSVTSPEEATS